VDVEVGIVGSDSYKWRDERQKPLNPMPNQPLTPKVTIAEPTFDKVKIEELKVKFYDSKNILRVLR